MSILSPNNSSLLARLGDAVYRREYFETLMHTRVAAQIVANRKDRRWKQADLAEHAGMTQSRIAAIEDEEYESWSLSTLKRIAAAFDLVLDVRFLAASEALEDFAQAFTKDSLVKKSFAVDLAECKSAQSQRVNIGPIEAASVAHTRSTSVIPPATVVMSASIPLTKTGSRRPHSVGDSLESGLNNLAIAA